MNALADVSGSLFVRSTNFWPFVNTRNATNRSYSAARSAHRNTAAANTTAKLWLLSDILFSSILAAPASAVASANAVTIAVGKMYSYSYFICW